MRVALLAFAAVAVTAGVVHAATIAGTGRAERLTGTARSDLVLPRGGPDRIDAGRGDDRIAAQYDFARDVVRCGAGRDVVTADAVDRVATDCEVVSRMLSRDTYTNAGSAHETQAEPDGFASGSTIVTTFQTGRRFDGGAADIGWATSSNGGRTWRRGHLPGLTVNSRPAGPAAIASDPVVAYDAEHQTWLISTLTVSGRVAELPIHRSPDGLRWSGPVVAAHAESPSLAYDKNWLACDNWPQSPRFGRCYLVYTDHQGGRPKMAVQWSDDGGLTWSPQLVALRAREVVGVFPVIRPDGVLVVPYLAETRIEALVSSDGGATWTAPSVVDRFASERPGRMRAFPLPSADVDASGRVYVTWHSCDFRASCSGNDAVIASSADGLTWDPPVRISRAGNAFLPAVAAEPTTGRLAVAYYALDAAGRVETWHATSGDRGATWTRPRRLSAQPMAQTWIPNTTSGRMLADYISVSWIGGRSVTVYALASEPRAGELSQAIFATQPLR
jgi:hypothetical protein